MKNSSRPLYFDCVVNAIVKGDEVVGASVLGRDITEQREKELRFTELFETCRKAFTSALRKAIAGCKSGAGHHAGIRRKGDLLAVEPAALEF